MSTCYFQGTLRINPFTLLGSVFLCTINIATLQISLFYFSSVLLAVQ